MHRPQPAWMLEKRSSLISFFNLSLLIIKERSLKKKTNNQVTCSEKRPIPTVAAKFESVALLNTLDKLHHRSGHYFDQTDLCAQFTTFFHRPSPSMSSPHQVRKTR
jgi:hypothetical protein